MPSPAGVHAWRDEQGGAAGSLPLLLRFRVRVPPPPHVSTCQCMCSPGGPPKGGCRGAPLHCHPPTLISPPSRLAFLGRLPSLNSGLRCSKQAGQAQRYSHRLG